MLLGKLLLNRRSSAGRGLIRPIFLDRPNRSRRPTVKATWSGHVLNYYYAVSSCQLCFLHKTFISVIHSLSPGRGSRLPTNQYHHHHHAGSGTQGNGSDGISGEVEGYGDGRGAMLGSGGGDSAVGTAPVVEGETLVLRRVSRLQMGSYLCIASNGIPPSISKRVHLSVQCEWEAETERGGRGGFQMGEEGG